MTTRRGRNSAGEERDELDERDERDARPQDEREAVLDTMSRDELVALVRRLRWGDDASGDLRVRDAGANADAEADNARLREGQMELAELGARYLDLYEEAPMAYCLLDDAGIMRELNFEASRLLAAEPWELRGKPLSRFVVPADRRGLMEHLTACIDRAEPATATFSFRVRPGAQPIAVQLVSRALGKEHGAVRGCRTAFFDVSAQKRGEESLRVAVRMRDDFLSVVAHDLRSPLAAIVMTTELLERKRNAQPRGPVDAQDIERIRRSAHRMARLVDDLLDLSSMDAGRLAIEPGMQRVESMLVSALEICSPLASAKQISLSAQVDHAALEAWCDRERVIQALINLLTNAIKFTTTGSVSVRAKRAGEEVHVVVHDTGRGMTRNQIEHAFDPFWQAAPRKQGAGAGLGLSIVKGIVQLHGGRVWVESRQGRGSSFSFTLPRAAPGSVVSSGTTTIPPSLEVTAPLPRPSLSDLKEPSTPPRALVLLIDDEGEVRESISEALRSEGYEVVSVPHGRAALEYLDRANVMPTLILLDLVMPVMDGWEFLRQQSRMPRLSSVPVVLVSAQADSHRDTEVHVEERAPGLAGYIQKPVRLANLVDVVGTCTASAIGEANADTSTTSG